MQLGDFIDVFLARHVSGPKHLANTEKTKFTNTAT